MVGKYRARDMKILMYKRVRVRTEKSDGLKEYIDFLRNIAILL